MRVHSHDDHHDPANLPHQPNRDNDQHNSRIPMVCLERGTMIQNDGVWNPRFLAYCEQERGLKNLGEVSDLDHDPTFKNYQFVNWINKKWTVFYQRFPDYCGIPTPEAQHHFDKLLNAGEL